MLEQGDEVLADLTFYGCTFSFLNHGLTRFGVTVRHVDMTDPANVAQAMGPKTRVLYLESPANPNMRLVDIAAVSAIAHAGGARVVVDNTYCTPYQQQQPLLLGADVSVHSMTKYLGGHGDLMAGAAIFADAELALRSRAFTAARHSPLAVPAKRLRRAARSCRCKVLAFARKDVPIAPRWRARIHCAQSARWMSWRQC